jgi:hypothetical protein
MSGQQPRERRLFYTHPLAKAWAKLRDRIKFNDVASKVVNILAAFRSFRF